MSYKVPQPDHMKGKPDPWARGIRSAADPLPPGVTRVAKPKASVFGKLLKKISSEEAAAVEAAFLEAMQKEAFVGAVGNALGTVGKTVLGGVGRGAKAVGAGKLYGKGVGTGIRALGGGATGARRMQQVVGGATLGGAGLVAHRALSRD